MAVPANLLSFIVGIDGEFRSCQIGFTIVPTSRRHRSCPRGIQRRPRRRNPPQRRYRVIWIVLILLILIVALFLLLRACTTAGDLWIEMTSGRFTPNSQMSQRMLGHVFLVAH